MSDAEMIDQLLAACRAYHDALDRAFAALIEATRGKPTEPFFPTKSPMWPAMVAGHDIMLKIEAELARRTP